MFRNHADYARNKSIAYLNGRTKRLLDIIGAIIGIIIGFPLFAVACMIVRIVDDVPPLFRQERIGYGGKAFTITKLRTLPIIEYPPPSAKRIANKPQYATTLTGRFWRVHSIDEIYQFWIVLKGDMSLIGHRPIPMYYLEHLQHLDGMDSDNAKHYIRSISKFKPGMSSLSSVNGRGNLTMLEKIEYDLQYANKASFLYDLELLARTVIAVITCEGAK